MSSFAPPCSPFSRPALAAPATAQSTTIVISEYRTRGPAGGNDEFIELRNNSAAPVDIGGYA